MARLTGNTAADRAVAGAVLVAKGLMAPTDFKRSVEQDLAGLSPQEQQEVRAALRRYGVDTTRS
jgi:hypothetical protein